MQLPDSLLRLCSSFLPLCDLARLRRCSKKWNVVTQAPEAVTFDQTEIRADEFEKAMKYYPVSLNIDAETHLNLSEYKCDMKSLKSIECQNISRLDCLSNLETLINHTITSDLGALNIKTMKWIICEPSQLDFLPRSLTSISFNDDIRLSDIVAAITRNNINLKHLDISKCTPDILQLTTLTSLGIHHYLGDEHIFPPLQKLYLIANDYKWVKTYKLNNVRKLVIDSYADNIDDLIEYESKLPPLELSICASIWWENFPVSLRSTVTSFRTKGSEAITHIPSLPNLTYLDLTRGHENPYITRINCGKFSFPDWPKLRYISFRLFDEIEMIAKRLHHGEKIISHWPRATNRFPEIGWVITCDEYCRDEMRHIIRDLDTFAVCVV